MSDPIIDLIYDIDHNGIRIATAITLYSLFRKERRNHYLDLRDEALFQNLKILMEDRGLGSCFVENPNLNKNMEEALLRRGLTIISPVRFIIVCIRLMAIKNWRYTMQNLLSKKLLLGILGALIPIINVQFGLHLTFDDLVGTWTFLGLVVAFIAHVDKARLKAALKTVEATVIADPNASYQDLVKVVNIVHTAIAQASVDFQKRDASQAYIDATNFYAEMKQVTDRYTHPAPIPVITEVI